MDEQKTAVLMDSGGDLPYELCQKEGIEFLPLHIIYPEKDYQDGIDIDPQIVYDRYPDEIPTTSTPSLHEVLTKFEELK
ncbi:MAG: DegV family protein, partial [Parasporobacterium sp.]|nr:DegV family protein [Parasporobacterium sp.]